MYIINNKPYTLPRQLQNRTNNTIINNMWLNRHFSLQMVQAIQVLRFHLLELEKVSIYTTIVLEYIWKRNADRFLKK